MMIIGDPTVQIGNQISVAPYETGPLTAGQSAVHRQATCPGECTQDFSTTINVFASFYHMHNYGSKMFTEKYATSSNGGGSLGVVGGRIDFWDNGFQQNIEMPYTVAPGETLQTHCFFDVSQQSSDIHFGTATSEEMCMEFIFYYPVQTRGANQNGDPEAFALCGMLTQGNAAQTVCGSLSQAGGFFVTDAQVAKSSSPAIADPLAFGVANLPALASVDGAACVAPSPPYPLSPPRPLGPPGSEVETVYMTRVEMIVAGAVSDVTVAKRASIAEAFATAAGVDASQVDVTVQAASVLIAVVITSTTQAASNTVSSTLTTALATSTAATTLIAATGLTVTSTPTLTSFTDTRVVPPSAPASSKRAGHLAHGILMSVAFAFLMPTGVVFPLFLRRRLSRWLLYHKTTQLTGERVEIGPPPPVPRAACRLLRAACRLLRATCRLLRAACRLLRAACRLLRAACRLPRAIDRAACHQPSRARHHGPCLCLASPPMPSVTPPC